MSKKRHRNRDDDYMQPMNNRNNSFGGINPQMLEMLGLNNMDMNKLSMLMTSMNRDGFDINMLGQLLGGMQNNPTTNRNANMNGMNNPMSNMAGNMPGNMAAMMSMLGNMNNRQMHNNNMNNNMHNNNMNNNMHSNMNNNRNLNINKEQKKHENIKGDSDENIEMLLSVRRLVDDEKVKFIDKVIEMYKAGEIKY
ncbi:hypothetical protein [Clostridium sp.]|uniref:hypothetical protein n=1 Tax=Clostridium sp. TaxID=1506 RepID=UPI0039930285